MSSFLEKIWEYDHPFKLECNKECCTNNIDETLNENSICPLRIEKLEYFNNFYQIILETKQKYDWDDWTDEHEFKELGKLETGQKSKNLNIEENSFIEKNTKDEVLEGLDTFVGTKTNNSTLNTIDLLSPRPVSSRRNGGYIISNRMNLINNTSSIENSYQKRYPRGGITSRSNSKDNGSLSPRVLIGEISEGNVRVNHYTRDSLDPIEEEFKKKKVVFLQD